MEVSGPVKFPTKYAEFTLASIAMDPNTQHAAVWLGDLASGEPPLIRIQSACVTGTALRASICDCATQLDEAMTATNEAHIVGLNVALEAASFDFFSKAAPHLDSLGIGHEYWRVHMELDEFHSADGLALLKPVAEDSAEGRELLRVARETLLFWGFMLNSWVGVDAWPNLPRSNGVH
jgi:hypothetical protein